MDASKKRKKGIGTHRNPHFDDVASSCAITWYGRSKFPIVRNAEIYFTLDPSNPNCSKEDFYWVGIGGCNNSEVDEHGSEHPSALSIIANKLNLWQKPAWPRIIKWVNMADSGAGRGGSLNLHTMLESIHKKNEMDSMIGFDWCKKIISTIDILGNDYFCSNDNYDEAGRFFELLTCLWAVDKFSKVKFKKALNDYFPIGKRSKHTIEEVLEYLRMQNHRILGLNSGLGKYVKKGCRNERQPFSLPRAAYAVYLKSGAKDPFFDAYNWAKLALDSWYEDQESFWKMVDFFEKGYGFETLEVPGFQNKKIIFVPGNESLMTLRAARYFFKDEFAFLFQHGGILGNQIFAGKGMGFNPLDKVAEKIYSRELALLKERGETDIRLNHIYYIQQKKEGKRIIGSNMILNRSSANQTARRMLIKPEEILEIIKEGLRERFNVPCEAVL